MHNTYTKGLNLKLSFNEFYLRPEEDAEFMAGIDMEEQIAGIEQSESKVYESIKLLYFIDGRLSYKNSFKNLKIFNLSVI